MRTLRDQILASTHMDRSGDRIPRDALRRLYRQLDSETMSGVMHDITQPPVVRLVGKRLEELADGELAIKVDYEILDEERFAKMGGFSISFLRRVFRSGTGVPAFRVLVNPEQFDIRDASELLKGALPRETTFEVIERVEKALGTPEAILIICLWLGGEVLRGFLASVGADLLKALRSLPRRDGNATRPQIQIEFLADPDTTRPDVVLRIPDGVDAVVVAAIDAQRLDSFRTAGGGRRLICKLEPNGDIAIVQWIDLTPTGCGSVPEDERRRQDAQEGAVVCKTSCDLGKLARPKR